MTDWAGFMVNEWCWSITWGWYQLALGLLLSTALFMMMHRLKSLPLLILIITSYWSAFIVYLVFVSFLSLYMVTIAQQPIIMISQEMVPLNVAFFFTLLQLFFLYLVHDWYRVRLQCVMWVTFAGNGLAALITFLLVYITNIPVIGTYFSSLL